jgi:hypothetical protein
MFAVFVMLDQVYEISDYSSPSITLVDIAPSDCRLPVIVDEVVYFILVHCHIIVIGAGPETRRKHPVRQHEKNNANGCRVQLFVLSTRPLHSSLHGHDMGHAGRSMVQRFNGHAFEILNILSL